MRGALLATALFGIAAFALLNARPLWLDEILELIETTQPSTADMIATLPRNAGAAPLGYLVQRATLGVTGYSVRAARLPSALFAIGAVWAVAVLAARLGLRLAWLAASLFALFPMTLRYATESRVYSQALFLSVVASLCYLRLSREPNARRAAVYCLALAASAYTQPYSAAVAVAHLLWSVISRDRRTALWGSAALGGAILAFLPWYAWSRASWAATVAAGALHFSASPKTALLVFREVTGGGYWCSTLLLALCALAFARRLPNQPARAFLVLMIAVPVALILSADAVLDYFVASRQFLWILPAIAVLAAAPIERGSRAAAALAASLAMVSVVQDVRFFARPRENWSGAANVIAKAVDAGACFSVAPGTLAVLYEFFRPELKRAHCEASCMVLAVTPYTTRHQRETAVAMLKVQGYHATGAVDSGGSQIIFFRR